MSEGEYQETVAAASGEAAMILQVERPGDEPPLQFPAVVRNLAAGVVTLEVNNPWTILNWETLKGQDACLRLLSADGEVSELKGTVTWTRYSVQDQDRGNLSLALKLAEPTLTAQKSISDQIPHTSKDIRGLWDRWEEVQQSTPEPAPFSTKLGLAALGLLATGVGLQLPGPKALKLLGWGFWFFGTLIIAGQTLRFWRSRKAPR